MTETMRFLFCAALAGLLSTPAAAARQFQAKPEIKTTPRPAAAALPRLAAPATPGAAAVRIELPAAQNLQPLQRQIAADKDASPSLAGESAAALSLSLSQTFDKTAAAPPLAQPFAEAPDEQPQKTQRRLEEIPQLRLGTYNVLNLFEKVGKWVPDRSRPGQLKQVLPREAKAEWQLRESAKAIKESALDIVVLQEVENIAALEQFNERYLDGEYRTFLIEGNDGRGIDVAFLVKKDIPFEVEQRSHKDELWSDPVLGGPPKPLFSRDLPSLIVRAPGRAQPLFVMFGTHYKSKRDRHPRDRQSRALRQAQVERSAEIVARYRKEFGANVPVLFAGDFNGEMNKEPEFAALKRIGLVDSLDLAKPPLSEKDRITHTYHPRGEPAHKQQMDAIMISETMRTLVSQAWVYRYRDAQGKVKPIPDTYKQREKNPSDHYPVVLILKFQPLLNPAP